jgi:hypothetical protein
MKKIQLDVDGLKVESFTTSEVSSRRGTVQAHDSAYPCTVYDSCNYTVCGYPCGGGGSHQMTCGAGEPCTTTGPTAYDSCEGTGYKVCG